MFLFTTDLMADAIKKNQTNSKLRVLNFSLNLIVDSEFASKWPWASHLICTTQPNTQTYLFCCISTSNCWAQQDVPQFQQSGSKMGYPEGPVLLIAVASRSGFRRTHGKPGERRVMAGSWAVRWSLWIVVTVAMMDGTGERVQFLQRNSELHPHSGGKQILAGKAEERRTKWPLWHI